MTSLWTTDQILALAPDEASAKAGRGLANTRKWLTLGRNERALWGECQGSGKTPYQVEIDLNEPAFKCTCPSRKFPCKHGLGLFLLFASQSSAFTEKAAPAWVAEWLVKRDQLSQRKQAKAAETAESGADPTRQAKKQATQSKRAVDRQARVAAGLAELELWLRDLLRQGLAAVQTQPPLYWDNMAARLVDAQAPGLARWLHDMSAIPRSGEGWTERLLARLGLLYLLLAGFKQIEKLPAPVQADIRTVIGWTTKEEELAPQPGLPDTWLVLGQYSYEEERLRVQRTWLWGQSRSQPALALDFAFKNQPLDLTLVPGRELEAELVFYPSNYPLRALVKNRLASSHQLTSLPAQPTIETCLLAYTEALARQPWLELFPVSLASVNIIKNYTNWYVRDEAGRLLPLSPHFKQGWRLLALSAGQPLALFGEWDGRFLLPLSVWVEGRFVPLL
jgi:hypothetical protein